MIEQAHRTWIELDRSAVTHNTQRLAGLLKPGVAHCAVVKANAYGHGLKEMVQLLSDQGIVFFGADSIDEAMQIREAAPRAEIIVLGYTISKRFHDVIRANVIQTIANEEQLATFNQMAAKAQTMGRISLKLETGTMRRGIDAKKLPRTLMTVKQQGSLELASVHSHFCDSESKKGEEFTFAQYNLFADLYKTIRAQGFDPRYVHISSSAATTLFPDLEGNVARFGIMNYGLWPSKEVKHRNQISPRGIELKPVLSWRTRIAQIKDIPPGTTIGYDRTFVSDRPMRIAVLPVGYYDGYRRTYRDGAEFLIHGQRCRVLGSICMNMMMVDVSQLPQVKRDDIATLLGRDGMHVITAEHLAEWGRTINYEATTQISPHLPRIIV